MIIDEAKQDTKLPAIMEAAVRLFVQKGVSGTTIRDIARAARVAEGTLYRHYRSKEDLAYDILEKNLRTFTDYLDRQVAGKDTLEARLYALTLAFVQAWEDNGDLARFMLMSHAGEMARLPKDMRQPRHVVMDILKAATKTDEVAMRSDLEVLQAMLLGALVRVLLAKAHGEVRADLASRAAEISRNLQRMLGVAKED